MDIDSDGCQNNLGASLSSIALWRNLDGGGCDYPFSVHVSDIDEGGKLDIVSVSGKVVFGVEKS